MRKDESLAENLPEPESPRQATERPILVLAAQLDAEQRLFDGAGQGTGTEGSIPKRIAALEACIAALEAQDLSEAAVQLMLAGALVERRREGLIEDDARLLAQLEALTRSALSALCRISGFDLKPYGGDPYLPAARPILGRA